MEAKDWTIVLKYHERKIVCLKTSESSILYCVMLMRLTLLHDIIALSHPPPPLPPSSPLLDISFSVTKNAPLFESGRSTPCILYHSKVPITLKVGQVYHHHTAVPRTEGEGCRITRRIFRQVASTVTWWEATVGPAWCLPALR